MSSEGLFNKCYGCPWKQVDACELKQYDSASCPVEQRVRGIKIRKMGRKMTSFNSEHDYFRMFGVMADAKN